MMTHSTTQEPTPTTPTPLPTRPPAPPARPVSVTTSRQEPERLADRQFADSFKPMPARPTLSTVLDALLKTPARVVHEIVNGDRPRVTVMLTLTAIASYAVYGVVVGSFAGGHSLWRTPLKLVGGIVVSGLICLPSLYILTSIDGGKQTIREAGGLLALLLALSGALLVGFAPISWVFSVSTGTVAFMGGLHLAMWSIATLAGITVVMRAFRFLNGGNMAILKVWSAVFIVVALQMSTVLRPLIDEADEEAPRGKMFFLKHWGNCLSFEGRDAL